MKNLNYLWLAGGLFLLGSCSSEAPDQLKNGPEDEGEGYFMKVAFNSASTRAATDENVTTIANAAFLFYDENKAYYATRYIGNTAAGEQDDENINWIDGSTHDVDKCAVIQLSKVPHYVACVVNADKDVEFGSDLDGNEVSKVIKKDTKNLLMSSQTIYAGTSHSRTYLKEIDIEKMIKTKKSDAEAAPSGETLVLNVEPVCAKIEITNNNFSSNVKGKDQFTDDVEITFTPEVVGITGWNNKGYVMKQLPQYSGVAAELINWADFLDEDTGVCGWVGATAGTVEYHTMAKIFENNAIKPNLSYAGAWGKQYFYPFENFSGKAEGRTNLFVLGKYTVGGKDADGKDIKAATDGTFYLMGVGDKFEFFNNETDLIKKMGGVTEGDNKDTLVEDRTNANDHKTWTGWMKLSKTKSAFKCIKYTGGYGYYAHEIKRAPSLTQTAIVRNTHYILNVKTIDGIGVGLPTTGTEIIPVTPPDPSQQTYYMHIGVDVQPWVDLDSYDVEWKKPQAQQ